MWGNILAFLFNIIDIQRARTAFEFMWGVGVNQPYPVKNLYPPVITGDPASLLHGQPAEPARPLP